ncbi:MAG: sulfatase-like hydrolase/transferase [Candidatus Latescibacterota bacterium]|nr:sulfatase-like hydrolase/transferase [Candidatus Latescibacterota bacterium]
MKRPNILLIMADDMGYGDFGVSGDGSPGTPRLDSLVDEGACLTQHYSGSQVCSPARAALLTERYPHRVTSLMRDPEPERVIPRPPAPELYHLATLLKRAI